MHKYILNVEVTFLISKTETKKKKKAGTLFSALTWLNNKEAQITNDNQKFPGTD